MNPAGHDPQDSLSVPPVADEKAPGIAAAAAGFGAAVPVARVERYPPGIPYIIGNEAAERFSYYGMRAILTVHMAYLFQTSAGMSELKAGTAAIQVFSLFTAGVYAFPMVGAILADRLVGKYYLILWVSLLYCGGHAVLAAWGNTINGMYAGLTLIAMGSGGIKPCVSANVGDQFTAENAGLIPNVYRWFYFSINFGSFFSTLLIPYLRRNHGAEVAFAVPGVLMALATLVFWLGRDRFTKIPPRPAGRLGLLDSASAISLFLAFAVLIIPLEGEKPSPDAAAPPLISLPWKLAITGACLAVWYVLFSRRQSISPDPGFLSVLVYCLRNGRLRQPGDGFFSPARHRFGAEAAEGPPAVLKIMLVFSMVSVFWALFDQHSSSWIKQAERMDLWVGIPLPTFSFENGLGFTEGFQLDPSQTASANPFMVMIMIPLLALFLYGPLEKRGIPFPPLLRMTVGMFLAALSFVAIALIQQAMDSAQPAKVHVGWQLIAYVLITMAEVLVSVTGLEFAYTQAPRSMKSTIMGFWYLTVTVGNLLTHALAPRREASVAGFFWTFAGLMAAASVVFAILSFFYKGKTYLQDST
jgi:proton-dependent oligopeptide transporter, POT family